MSEPVTRVHAVFKTHFDYGFTDLAHRVLEEYLEVFLPRAMRTAEILASQNRPEQFVWTVSSFVLHAALEQADVLRRTQLEQAIAQGWLVWHALPFTPHLELMDASLLKEALYYSQELDAWFGRHTRAAKITDVPGLTRAAVPILFEAGVRFLHVGINGAVARAEVPEVFVWRDPPSGAALTVVFSGEYGGVTVLDGAREALAVEFTRDNLGPPSAEGVILTFRQLQARFPQAQVIASSLDRYFDALEPFVAGLPIFEGEIGDSWIHGAGSDPRKLSDYRELSRLRQHWLHTNQGSEATLRPFSRELMKVAEHTWGLDAVAHLGESEYLPSAFGAARSRPSYRAMEASWAEQRGYLTSALEHLPAPLLEGAQNLLSTLTPVAPSQDGLEHAPSSDLTLHTSSFNLEFDAQTGAIIGMRDRRSGREWAGPQHPLALLSYQTFSVGDHQRFIQAYIRPEHQDAWWVPELFGRPEGVEGQWTGQLEALFRTEASDRGWLELTLPLQAQALGAPKRWTLEVEELEGRLSLTLSGFDKPACRLAEASWLSFTPHLGQGIVGRLDKLGMPLSPLEVVSRGNRSLHGVGEGFVLSDSGGSFRLETLDAALIAPGRPALLEFDDKRPDLGTGMHVNLHNNVWNTNFRLWYEEDVRFRFLISTEHQRGSWQGDRNLDP